MQRLLYSRLLNQRCYIAFPDELGLQFADSLGGLSAVGLSSLIAEKMPDEFIEPGPAICVRAETDCSPVEAAMAFDGCVLHEFTHVVLNSLTEYPSKDGEALRELVATEWRSWPSHAGSARWIGHDARFIRALLHLHHRCKSRSHRVWLDWSFPHETYDLSSAEIYREALGDEPSDTDLLPIQTALARPMPASFWKLWSHDVVRSLGLKSSI